MTPSSVPEPLEKLEAVYVQWAHGDGLVVHYGVYRDRDEARKALLTG